MPTFIKTGFWDKLSTAPKNYLDLDLLIASAASSILPSQLGNNGKFLTTNGSTLSWGSISLTGLVPYTGATQAVNLGAFDLTVNGITVGRGAFSSNTNTALGLDALKNNSSGLYNTATGYHSLRLLTSGFINTSYGFRVLNNLTTGSLNNAFGSQSLQGLTIGTYNNVFGASNANTLVDGSYNTIIGSQINVGVVTLNNNIILADGQGNIKYRWDGVGNTITGDLTVTGVFKETVTSNTQTASYSLLLADRGKLIQMNVASANTLTVPLESSINFPIGSKIDVTQFGAGATTITAAVGVTIRSFSAFLKLAGQYAGCTLVKIGTNEWHCYGNLIA